MISPRAKIGFESLLKHCLEDSLRTEMHPSWSMEPVTEPNAIGTQRFIMLTLSSYDFRLLLMLHFSHDDASAHYVADSLKFSKADLAETQYYDFLAEVGNNFCGSFKRELGHYFPHMGMSTPNQLDRASLKHVQSWPIDHAIHIKAQSEMGVQFYGSLYVSAFGELDFDLVLQLAGAEIADVGALELF